MTGTGASPGTDPTSDPEPTRDAASTPTPDPAPDAVSTPVPDRVSAPTPDAVPAPAPDPVSAPTADGGWAPLTTDPTPPETAAATAQPPAGDGPPSSLPAAVPPYGPPAGWHTPPPPARRHHSVLIAAVTACVVLVMACFGLAGGLVLLRKTTNTASGPTSRASSPTTDRGRSAADRPSASPSTDPGPSGSAQPELGPEASAYAPTEIQDLHRMCDDNVYYPQAPKRAGRAPHPVVVLVDDGSGLRHQDSGYYYSEGLSDRVERTWAAQAPGKVQMVACLDRVSAGATIRQCSFNDPKPEKLPLVRAGWRLRVYEVATGRTLLDKAMPGDDRACPYVVMLFGERKIYAEVSDKALLAALRKLVTT